MGFSPTEINDFNFFQPVDLYSGFAGLLLIGLGQFNSHLLKNVGDTSKVPIRHLLSGTKERSAFTVSLPQVGDSNCTESLENSVELLPIVHSLALFLLPVFERLSVFSVMTQVVLITSAPHGAWVTDYMTLDLKNF